MRDTKPSFNLDKEYIFDSETKAKLSPLAPAVAGRAFLL